MQGKEDSNNVCEMYRKKKTAIMCVSCVVISGLFTEREITEAVQGKEDSNNVCQLYRKKKTAIIVCYLYREKKTAIMRVICTGKRRQQ